MAPQVGFVGGAVQLPQPGVQRRLVGGVGAGQGGSDGIVDCGDGAQDAPTLVTRRVAVPQFNGLMPAGGRAGGNDGPAQRAALQPYVHLHGGVAAGVQHLAGVDSANVG